MFWVKPAGLEDKPVIFNLLQLDMDELSQFPDEEPDYKDEKGVYSYPYFDHYWREHERFPYLLYSDSAIAGFALVRQDGKQWEMAEFYVLPQFRLRSLATTCVTEIFKKHPGKWKIGYNKYNKPGQALWQKAAERFSKGDILVEEDASHDYLLFSV